MFSKTYNDDVSILDLVQDNDVVAISGFNMATTPEYLINQLYNRYHRSGHPKNLFIISDALPAVPGRGLDHVAKQLYEEKSQDFLKGSLMPFLGFSPWFQKLVIDNRIECYGWPIGITAYWFREVASGRPGLLTKIGLDTFLDPRKDDAALNELSRSRLSCRVEIIGLDGEDYLFYKAPKPNFALIRASFADEMGNVSMKAEGIRGTVLSIAQATKARPAQGKVVCQVRWIVKSGTINPRDVDIPFPLIDHIVISPGEYHWQTGSIYHDPRISNEVVSPANYDSDIVSMHNQTKMYEKVIARRVTLELVGLARQKKEPVLINLGIGIPALISSIVREENIADVLVLVIESGPWGGVALSGNDFGLAMSSFALSTIPDMFSNFEGGIVDAASLGFLQIDKLGNVNPSMLPNRLFGAGGFPVIAGGVSKIFFAGSFTGGGKKEIDVNDKGIKILQDGPINKFVENVYKISFSGYQAAKWGQEIIYITERAVFRLDNTELVLEEIAPGIDIEKDILLHMDFKPKIPTKIKEMDARLFGKSPLNIKDDLKDFF
ncbi:acyl CoA:acetate/3-ketoacid CoA transferase [Candidatus Nitrosocosmicus franklandus]|uniref:Acetate CoA-transferase YdiF n=1 Tax=Candidatus Nitrosocosmicus franklandianus TaxID=1798806 RepID=A0A484IDZ1_9ARCH|nr:CoA-transferase [Candidatus Nitrosocosmicus franklandus]VFJ13880.1 Acetate CoA-transferase YdiF [Candidatus Nitrosocosmicus franklandus]